MFESVFGNGYIRLLFCTQNSLFGHWNFIMLPIREGNAGSFDLKNVVRSYNGTLSSTLDCSQITGTGNLMF